MCGICGYLKMNDCTITDSQLFTNFQKMMLRLKDRGRDASGVGFTIKEDGYNQVFIYKAPVDSSFLVKHKKFKRLRYDMPELIIGHCRATTQGKEENNKNNHPIVSKKTQMAIVHNGIVHNDDELFKEHKLERDAEVDSEIIVKMIEMYFIKNNDVIKSITKAVNDIKGSMSFAMLYKDKIYVYPNGGKVYIGYDETKKIVYFSQSVDSLYDVIPTRSILIFQQPQGVIRELNDDTIYVLSKSKLEYFTFKRDSSTAYYTYNKWDYNSNLKSEKDTTNKDEKDKKEDKSGTQDTEDTKDDFIIDICPVNEEDQCVVYNLLTAKDAWQYGFCEECKEIKKLESQLAVGI